MRKRCLECGTFLQQRQRMYCSILCRNRNSKPIGGWNNTHTSVICENCGKQFRIPPNRKRTARACSRACLGALQSKERKGVFGIGESNPMWIDGRCPTHYRKFLKDFCERCRAADNLLIHHKDRNRKNNNPKNLETLCRSCHAK